MHVICFAEICFRLYAHKLELWENNFCCNLAYLVLGLAAWWGCNVADAVLLPNNSRISWQASCKLILLLEVVQHLTYFPFLQAAIFWMEPGVCASTFRCQQTQQCSCCEGNWALHCSEPRHKALTVQRILQLGANIYPRWAGEQWRILHKVFKRSNKRLVMWDSVQKAFSTLSLDCPNVKLGTSDRVSREPEYQQHSDSTFSSI